MPIDKIKVLIVDDSAFMRKAIENMITTDPSIEVVGFARNGKEAIELTASLDPDVITLDIAMPVMDGVEALKVIMKNYPRAVIMVSSYTTEDAEITLECLDIGAVDFITKDRSYASFGILKIEQDLIEKIKFFGSKRQKKPFQEARKIEPEIQKEAKIEVPRPFVKGSFEAKVVCIGTSTGGPQALQKVIPKLPANLGKPVLVVQHMPPNFTNSLANRLNSLSSLTVVEAQGKEKLEDNVVYIAKGGYHLKVRQIGAHFYTELTHEPSDILYIPSVDVLFSSVTDNYHGKTVGVIMTGMGKDGFKGCQLIKNNGGKIIAQDEKSCIVYGMPKVVVEANLADSICPVEKIADEIVKYCA